MAIEFTNASVLGVEQNSELLGDGIARVRSVKTLTIEGFLDSRANTDLVGIKQTRALIEGKIADISSSVDTIEAITINGTSYGDGRVTRFEASSRPSVKTDHIILGEYSATIEFYLAGSIDEAIDAKLDDGSTVTTHVVVPEIEYLESYSDAFSISLSGENEYEYNHDLGIKYSASAADPIKNAKSLAAQIFRQAIASFDTDLGLDQHWGNKLSPQGIHYTEVFDVESNDCNFSKVFKLLPKEGLNWSSTITNSININREGIVEVNESGEIEGGTDNGKLGHRNELVMKGIDAELALSHGRCNTLYNSYKDYFKWNSKLKTGNDSVSTKLTLNVKPVSLSKTLNTDGGTGSYNISYTNNEGMQGVEHTIERNISLRREGNTIEVEETGNITSFGRKRSNYDTTANVPKDVDVKVRCEAVYKLANYNKALKLKSSNSRINKFGKSIDYGFSYTDDPTVKENSGLGLTFSKIKITAQDNIGAPIQQLFQIPNAGNQVAHTAGQTNIGTRTVQAECIVRREDDKNILYDLIDGNVNAQLLKNTLIQKAFEVFSDNPSIRSSDVSTIHITDLNYTFNSNYELNMTVTVNYVMGREIQVGEDNLFN